MSHPELEESLVAGVWWIYPVEEAERAHLEFAFWNAGDADQPDWAVAEEYVTDGQPPLLWRAERFVLRAGWKLHGVHFERRTVERWFPHPPEEDAA